MLTKVTGGASECTAVENLFLIATSAALLHLCVGTRPPAAEFQPNSPKNNRWPNIRRKKKRLAENPPNSKISAAAENNCG